jgi:DNA-binding NtrC family response regulator
LNFLIVDDDSTFSEFLKKNLSKHGKIFIADSFINATNLLESYSFDCAILDLKLGNEVVGPKLALMAKRKGIGHVIAVTHFENDEELIREAYESGADDFVKKSNLKTHLEFFIKKVVTGRDLKKNVQRMTKTQYLTKDADLISSLENVCDTYAPMEPIYIGGESGVGKTQLGKCLKELLKLEGPLVELNCAGMNDEILKSELFGHEKGAFTGADQRKIGKIELAHNGILFLDEVGDLPLFTQEKLLKVLEEKEFTRVGGLQIINSDFLLVTATLRNLEELVESGKMRPDFYNRIMGKTIKIKPLRERKPDLKLLIDFFLNSAPRSVYLNKEAKEILMNYSWPGNIRELQKLIYRLSDTKHGIVTKEHLKNYVLNDLENQTNAITRNGLLTKEQILFAKKNNSYVALMDQLKKEFFDFALNEAKGNKSGISKNYQVSRKMLHFHYGEKTEGLH